VIKSLLLRHYARAAPALDLAAAAYRSAVISYDAYGAHNAEVLPELQRELATVLSAPGTFELWSYTRRFEQAFARACGRAHAVGTCSGTAALQLALLAAGVGPGDEVITSAHTFVATALAIHNTGARPVLVDPDPSDLCLRAEPVLSALTPRTRAIVPVHMHGHLADAEAIAAGVRGRGVAVIEDCAQAHGAARGGAPVPLAGTGIFSFFASKPLGGAGNGGVLVTDDAALAAAAERARDPEGDDPLTLRAGRTPSYLDALEAAVLSARLPRLGDWRDRREANALEYRAALAHLRPVLPGPDAKSAWYSFVLRVEERDRLKARLLRAGVETKIEYAPSLLDQRALRERHGWRPEAFPVAREASRSGLSLPMHPFLTVAQREQVIEAVRRAGV
jgi:dTDP-4-amino-4,6-dideoxygalactose transaminase